MKFHLYNFHDRFDWLLGLDNIKKLKAKCDFENDFFVTPNCKFKIYYQNVNNKDQILNYLESNKIDLSKFRLEHLNFEEKNKLINLIKEFSPIFQKDDTQLTFTNRIKHRIRTKDEFPVYTKSYRYPEVHRAEVRKQINDMLEQKIIQPSHSPWSSPIWVVPKKSDASGIQKWRTVIDYRKLNEKTIDDRYPIPNITDLLDKLGRCNYFTTLDLASGFHQIEMHPDDIEKTAFSVENGHYEFLRMPFGLKNAPSTFQRVMDDVLRGLQNEICVVYLDDIIVFGTSLQEHLDRLKLVFTRLREANFKVQLDKCEFLQREVAYLGHIVTPEGVKPNPDKIKAVQNFKIPKTKKDIKSFLGLLGYYRKFINNFAKITKPMTKLLKKDAIINVDDPEYKTCFEYCKNLLTNEPILIYPDFNQTFHLTTDASNYAIGAVLSQGPVGQDRPVAYASRTLNSHEINYSTIEKELLAIVWATKYFRPYLYGRKFNIFTDHKPLEWLSSIKEPNTKFARWKEKLDEYNGKIEYKKGCLNKVADGLSRIECNHNETQPPIFDYMKNFNNELENDDSQSMIVEPDIDTLLNTDEESVNPDNDSNDDITVHSNIENPITGIPILEKPVNSYKNQIFIKEVPHSPQKLKIKKLFNGQFQRMYIELNERTFEIELASFIKEYLSPNNKYFIYFESPVYEKVSNIIQKQFKNSELKLFKCTKALQDVEDSDEQNDIIENYHNGKTNHRGSDETYNRLKERYFWPKLQKTVQEYINECDVCRLSKYDRHPLKLKYNFTPTASKPFEIVHIDSLSLDKQKFFTIVDSFSKYAQAYPLLSLHRTEIANKLLNFFSHHGIPKLIIADNGGEFKNDLLQEFLQLHKIDIHFISSQHPESNGIVERFHSTLIEHIRLFNNRENFKNEDIKSKVQYAIIAYNNTKHSTTKCTPFEIITGHLDINDPTSINVEQQIAAQYNQSHREKTKLIYQQIQEQIKNKKEKVIGKLNENREEVPDIPEKVFIKNKQKCSKTRNKYKIEHLSKINKQRKTAKMKIRNPQATENIHLSNVKRPTKNLKNKSVTGPSSSQETRQ